MAIPAEMMRQFSEMMTQQMAAITAQYDAHMKATNEKPYPTDSDDAESDSEPRRHTALGLRRTTTERSWTRRFSRRWTSLTENGKTGASHSNRQFVSSSHDAFDQLNWAEKEETEIIDVDAQA